jgi:hypothetical protein
MGIQRNFRLDENTDRLLTRLKEIRKQTKTVIVREALQAYAEKILKKNGKTLDSV